MLAKTEAAVQRFSYLVVLMLMVPIAIYIALDVLFYAWELFAKADYADVVGSIFWNRSMSMLSVDMPALLRNRFIVSGKIWALPSPETLHRIKTLIEVAAFVMIITMPITANKAIPGERPRSSSPSKRGRHKRSRQGTKGAANKAPPAPDVSLFRLPGLAAVRSASAPSQRYPDVAQECQTHSDVCSLCGMAKDNSDVSSTNILKGIAFVTQHPLSVAPDFWNGFRVLWSRLLRRSMRMLEGLSVVQVIKQHGILDSHGIGRGSMFGAGIVHASSRLAKRKMMRLLEHSQ